MFERFTDAARRVVVSAQEEARLLHHDAMRFVDVDEAEVSLGIWIAGNTAPMVQPAHAVLVDGTWKVSRSTVSHYARLAQQFSPPPD